MVRFWDPLFSLLVVAVLALNAVAPAGAQSWIMADPGFKLEFEQGTTKRGATVLRGYVKNDHGYSAGSIKLLIEGLDAGGAVTTTTLGYLPGIAPAFNRLYFEVPVKAAAASYRVRVASYEPIGRGGP